MEAVTQMTFEPETRAPDTGAEPDRSPPRMYTGFAFLLAVCTAVALVWLHDEGLLPQAPDKWTYDLRTALLSQQAPAQRSDIVVVLVGDDTLGRYKYRSPIDRGMMANLVRALDDAGAKVIGLDFLFDRKTEPEKDAALLAALRSTRHARVAIASIDQRVHRASVRQFKYQDWFLQQAGKPVGHAYFQHEDERWSAGDRIVRYHTPAKLAEFPAKTGIAPRCRASFARLVHNLAQGRTERPQCKDRPSEKAFLDILYKRPVRDGAYIAWMLEPAPGTDVFTSFSVREHEPGTPQDKLLSAAQRTLVKDRIVLVGGNFIDRDGHLTPLSVLGGATTQGVWIHAQILAQMLDGRSVRDMPRLPEVIGLIALGWLGFWLSRRYRLRRLDMGVSIIGIAVLGIIAAILFSQMNIIMPTATFFFAWLAGIWFGHFCERLLRLFGAAR